MEQEVTEQEYTEFRGRRKACKAQGLKGKKFRQCVRKLRKADKKLSRTDRKKLAKNRRHTWRKVKKDVKLQWREEGKGFFRKAWRVQAKISFLPFRAPFLALVRVNMFGLATKIDNLQKKAKKDPKNFSRNWRKFKVTWLGWGGREKSVLKASRIGSVRKPIFSKIRSVKGFDGSEEYEITLSDTPYSSVEGAWEAAAIAAASAVITSVIQLLANKVQRKQMMDEETEQNLGEMALETIDADPDLSDAQKRVASAVVENADDDDDDEDKIMGIPKTTFIISASLTGLLVLVGGVFLFKKYNK